MTRHAASVHEKKPFKCDICDYRSSQKRSINRFVSSVHERKKLLKCDICGYVGLIISTMP